jgi:SAM-dependent methyltransferase
MTGFEIAYRCAEPFLPPLYGLVRRRLVAFARESGTYEPEILDVGGRKSHYTIGVPARLTITELPRKTSIQAELNLGLNDEMVAGTKSRRTNVAAIAFDDMSESKLQAESFDCVVAVEVLEHVERDHDFLSHVHRILRPGGLFLMTTPNGDSVPVPTNVDHKRHYTRDALQSLLEEIFGAVTVEYAIVAGRARTVGLRSWSPRHPLRTLASMGANVVNTLQSVRPEVRGRATGTRHLIATARRGS